MQTLQDDVSGTTEATDGVGSPASASVLVAGEDPAQVGPVAESLRQHFEHVESSTDPAAAATEFERCSPDVIVLAFTELAPAHATAWRCSGSPAALHNAPSGQSCCAGRRTPRRRSIYQAGRVR